MLTTPAYSTRHISMLMLAVFAGIALWLFVPWGRLGGGFGSDGNAALPPSLQVDGTVDVTSVDGVVTRLVVPLAVRGDDGIVLGDRATVRAETFMAPTAAAAVPTTHSIAWLDGNGDERLDPGEHAVLTVDLPARTSVHPQNPLRLVIKPVDSMPLVIEDVIR